MAIDLPENEYYPIGSVSDLPAGERLFLEIIGEQIVLFNVGGSFYALRDSCTHDQGPLGDGDLEGYEIVCPRHGARFDIRTGKALCLPAVVETPAYPVRVISEEIQIGIPKKSES